MDTEHSIYFGTELKTTSANFLWADAINGQEQRNMAIVDFLIPEINFNTCYRPKKRSLNIESAFDF